MRICRFCGNSLQEWENGCPVCGAGMMEETEGGMQAMPVQEVCVQRAAVPEIPVYVQPRTAPVTQMRRMPAKAAAAMPAPQPTSPAGWFGWLALCLLLWIFGPLIMFRTVKNPSERNFAKMMLTLECVAVGLLALGIMGLGGLMFLDNIFF